MSMAVLMVATLPFNMLPPEIDQRYWRKSLINHIINNILSFRLLNFYYIIIQILTLRMTEGQHHYIVQHPGATWNVWKFFYSTVIELILMLRTLMGTLLCKFFSFVKIKINTVYVSYPGIWPVKRIEVRKPSF
jgi:hypothetical protein